MKKKILLFLLILLVFPFRLNEVNANSALKTFSGRTDSGIAIVDKESPIVVLKEDLTFNIESFPDTGDNPNYTSNVSAKYMFHNPSENYIDASLVFPFYSEYTYYDITNENNTYGVYVDDNKIEMNERYTYKNNKFNILEDIKYLNNNFVFDEYYSPDLKVDFYLFDFERKKSYEFIFDDKLYEGYKVFTNARVEIKYDKLHFIQNRNEKDIYVYIVGNDIPKMSLNIEDYNTTNWIRNIEYKEIEFKELVLSYKDKESKVSDIDYYNAAIYSLNKKTNNQNIISTTQFDVNDNLLKWYEYNLSFEPNQTIVNEVIAPLYPTINKEYDPPSYFYRYLLTPASTWKEFSNLDIRINTKYYMQDSSLEGFVKDENGYSLHLDKLPDKELEFRLSTSQYSNKIVNSIVSLLGIPLTLILGSILLLIIGSLLIGLLGALFELIFGW